MRPLLALALLAAPASGRPPNVVVIFTDDHAHAALSAYGDGRKLLSTPNLDRIAAGGVRFDRCLVPNSICGPSRASVLTGKYSHANGFLTNTKGKFDGSQVTFPKLLQAAGYQTAVIGKWHLVSDPTGFDHWHILPGQGVYYHPPMIKNGVRAKQTGYVTDVITDLSLDWLAKRDMSKPFLLMCQHKAPHREWEPALRHLGHDGDRKYPEPPTLFDAHADRGAAVREADMSIAKTMTPRDLKLVTPAQLTTAERQTWDAYYASHNTAARDLTGDALVRWKYNRYMHDYLACVKAVDESAGRVLDFLDKEGLADSTVVVYASDQGFYLGEHGWFDKRWPFEQSLTTPLLVRWPGVAKPGTTCAAMASTLDLAPTILEAAGVAPPAGLHGKSLTPLLKGGTPAGWRTSFYTHYYENPGPHAVAKHYGVVTDRYKLIHFYEPKYDYWELYDRQADPLERASVLGKPGYETAETELRAELARLRKELAVPAADPKE